MDGDVNMFDYLQEEPAAEGGRRHAKRGGAAAGSTDWVSAALIAAIIVLVLVIGFLMWRRRYRSVPKCADYSGGAQQACAGLSVVCSDNAACLNAVAHCMPLVDSSAKASVGGRQLPLAALDPKAMRSCARAISRVDPAFAAGLASKLGGACVPPEVASALANPSEYAVMQGAADAAATLLPYSLEVGKQLPACKK